MKGERGCRKFRFLALRKCWQLKQQQIRRVEGVEKKCSFSSAVNLNKILSHYPLSHLAFLSLPPDLGSGLLTVYKLLEPFPGLAVPQKQSRGSKPHPLSSAPNKQQALKKQKKKNQTEQSFFPPKHKPALTSGANLVCTEHSKLSPQTEDKTQARKNTWPIRRLPSKVVPQAAPRCASINIKIPPILVRTFISFPASP